MLYSYISRRVTVLNMFETNVAHHIGLTVSHFFSRNKRCRVFVAVAVGVCMTGLLSAVIALALIRTKYHGNGNHFVHIMCLKVLKL